MTADDCICTVQMNVSCNARVSDVIEELAELTNENKYKISLVH